MTQTKSKKLVSVTVLLLVFVGMVGYGILWFLSKRAVLYDHSISALQMAQQQELSGSNRKLLVSKYKCA